MSRWLQQWQPKGSWLAVLLLAWIFCLHLAGVFLFTQGFLLTRLSLPNISHCANGECAQLKTHSRLIFLIIDALRFDFVSPDPPSPASPYYHNVLTLPQELTRRYPAKSFIYHAFSDPPTSTMQRIKGITTGSLPTFVDVSSSFGGTAIEEDSIINQMSLNGRKMVFMGDDTWMTVFPTLFNTSHPYDSFNVEDLHSVDNGVIRHLFPLLEESNKSWDTIVGHFLGVDHVGHRVGPDNPVMKDKLKQMDEVLRRIVELMDKDTLLVVLGDHGMDSKGDHGGDSDMETASAAWIYSKGRPLSSPAGDGDVPVSMVPRITFPGATKAHRYIQQIDLVPTLSLLLGLPIPFNNLGSIIPELFSRPLKRSRYDTALEQAMSLNSMQVQRYLDAYHKSGSGSELDGVWSAVEANWKSTGVEYLGPRVNENFIDVVASHFFNRFALKECRALWAQFNVVLMSLGLVSSAFTLIMSAYLYYRLGHVSDWEKWSAKRLMASLKHAIGSCVFALVVAVILRMFIKDVPIFAIILFGTTAGSCLSIVLDALSAKSIPLSLPIPLLLHSLAFFSNSFTFWEDRAVTYLLITCAIPNVLAAVTAPMARFRARILGYTLLYAVCVRLIAISTVCREEQQPYCHVTFYASSTLPSPPLPILLLSIPTSIALPFAIQWFLSIAKADKGLALPFLNFILRPALVASSACWIMEWLESSLIFGDEWAPALRLVRTIVSRCTVVGVVVGGSSLWWSNPLCLKMEPVPEDKQSSPTQKRQVAILGYTNAYGSPFALFACIIFAVVYLCTQLTGQVVLALAFIAMMAHVEATDSVRDADAMRNTLSSTTPSAALSATGVKRESTSFTFNQLTVFALLANHTFFGTGHQATFPSLQWKSAFLLTAKLSMPVSHILVLINTAGPYIFFGVAVSLLACWQFAPTPQPASRSQVLGGGLRASVGMMVHFSALFLGNATSSAWLRRHLMVWKVFAPRFMFAAGTLLFVDLAVLVGVGIGVLRISGRVGKLLEKIG